VRISHIAYDRKHSPATDPNVWFPLPALRRAAAAGRIGAVAPRFHGAPTNRSQRHTVEVDAPHLLSRLREDAADAAILVPNCPVCHQTCSLVARHLEAHGIPTVVMGCAKDIVEYIGVPRLLFSDFPLGNAAGRPNDNASQRFTLAPGTVKDTVGTGRLVGDPLGADTPGNDRHSVYLIGDELAVILAGQVIPTVSHVHRRLDDVG